MFFVDYFQTDNKPNNFANNQKFYLLIIPNSNTSIEFLPFFGTPKSKWLDFR